MKTVFQSRLSSYREMLEKKFETKVIFTGEDFNKVYPGNVEKQTEYRRIKMDQKDFARFIKSENI